MRDLPDRFWDKVDKNGPVPEHRPDLGPCHLWTASLDRRGYGKFWFEGKPRKAHRLAFTAACGEPRHLLLDHLCRVRRCVNHAHLEPVTVKVNTLRGESPAAHHARKTHCPKGHPYDEQNTIRFVGKRYCRLCQRDRKRKRP